MNGFKKRSEQKKQAILQAALDLFQQFGVQKVTIAEIAKEANVSQVTIYNYFESKDNLIREVFQFYVDGIWQEQKQLLQSDLPFHDKLEKIIFGKTFEANHISERFFEDFMKDYASGNSYVEKLYVEEALPLYIEFFQQGRKEGLIDPTISDEAILFYLQMFREYMQRRDVAEKVLPIADELTKLFFYGLRGK